MIKWAICDAWCREVQYNKRGTRVVRTGWGAYLAGIENKLRATCQAFRDNHEIAQRRAVIDDVAVVVRDERLLGAATENMDTVLIHTQPEILGKRGSVRLLHESVFHSQPERYCT